MAKIIPSSYNKNQKYFAFVMEKSNERSVALTTYCATRAMSGWPSKLIGHGPMCMQPTRAMPPTSPGSPSSLPCMLLFFNIACPINVLSPSYYLHFENRLHHCVLHGEMNKTRPHLHIFWRYFALLPTYVIASSLSRSNLCVYWFPMATTYAHRNFCFVSTYVYECMIDFVVVTNILYV